MAASAGTAIFRGKSGRTWSIDVYIPDATGTSLTFNPSGLSGTGSSATYRAPEDCALVDVATAAAPTAVGFVVQVDNAPYIGASIRWANQLNTLSKRGEIFLPIPRGALISALQF
jgi:hypothetical protein